VQERIVAGDAPEELFGILSEFVDDDIDPFSSESRIGSGSLIPFTRRRPFREEALKAVNLSNTPAST